MFGQRLKQLRKAKDLVQSDVGDVVGVSPKTVSGWENESREPDIATLVTLAQFFGTSVAYIVGETDDPRPLLQPGQAAHNADDPTGYSDLTPEDIQDAERFILEVARRRKERRRLMEDGHGGPGN